MNTNEKIRVFIVDDIAETREKIRGLLQFESDVEVIGSARTGREAIQLSLQLEPDVILMDINMPDIDGITATEVIRTKKPEIQVIMLSVQSDQNYMRRAMLAGARDYLTKPPMGDELISAIRRAGEMAITEQSKNNKNSWDLVSREKSELKLFYTMEAKQLELSTFDCMSRLQLYQNDLLKGKLADKFEILLTGIAHDLKSPISIATSILEIIANEDKNLIRPLVNIWRQLRIIKWIADNFLGICLSEKPGQSSFSVSVLTNNTLNYISGRLPKNIKIALNIPPNLNIISDGRILELTILNLLMNSIESIGQKDGQITISSFEKNEKTYLIVSDTGESIPEHYKHKIFDFGFTTKNEHLGNGLYVARRLLYQIYGELNYRQDHSSKLKSFEIVISNSQKEPTSTAQQNQELQTGLENLYSHLASLRETALPQDKQKLLQDEYNRQTSIFTNRLTEELLQVEKMILNTLRNLTSSDIELIDSMKKVEKNCTYCRLLTRNILEIGGGISLTISSVSLIEVIQEVLSLLSRKMPKDLYAVEFQPSLIVEDIEADPLQLMQVFMNLMRNALDAMPHGGKLEIYTGQIEDKVFARIHDSGIGIASENLSKLFTMGFSTKTNGYGIGLYSVKNIIDKHHGTITVQSKIGSGTIFTILLPKRQTF